ncbi:hypothetical protein RhiJN_15676 [Ceratobasidium sp. AG-Ba]|nr:hypothetical protein RhiJN_15676 [Ceratobasidium sp. AG-Ba]
MSLGEINSPNPHLLVNQTYIPTPMEWQYVNNPGIMLGPWMLGALLDFMFAGILLQQFYFYYKNFKNDALYIKIIVWTAMLLATMKTAQAFLIVWFKIIIAYGDWREAANWPSTSRFGRRTWLLLGLLLFVFIAWGCSFGVGLQIGLKNPYPEGKIPYAVIPMLVTTVLVDSVITTITLFYLLQSKKGFNPKTDNLVGRLIIITFEAALPPALSAICDTITSVTQTGNIHATFNMLTPRLYAFSLLFTINVRATTRDLAAGGSDHVSVQVGGSSDGANRRVNIVVGGRAASWFPKRKPDDRVRVETETVTVHHSESRTSERFVNTVNLSSHLENVQEMKSKEDETSSISSAWPRLDTKTYEMGSLGSNRCTDLPCDEEAQENPHTW